VTVRLSALRDGHLSPPVRFLVFISVRGLIDPRAIVRLEGLGKLKNISSIFDADITHIIRVYLGIKDYFSKNRIAV
jgi:hypothetical protein